MKTRIAAQVLLFAGAITLIRFAIAARLEPTPLEAYYWEYAQHPSMSYLDHPGMIGWMIWLSSSVFGDGFLGMRVIPILAGAGSIVFTFLAGRRLYGEPAGRLAALLVGVVPMTFDFGARATPDAPLLLFWTATIWALSRALSEEGPRWWTCAGAFLGLAMLSKYHAFFIPLGMAGFLAFSPEHRRWLRRKEPWFGLLLAVAIFTPVVLWNARHEWRSLAYQFLGRFAEDHEHTGKHLREFWRDQLLLATPVVAIWAWGAGVSTLWRWKSSPWQDRLTASLGLPMVLFFAAVAFLRYVPHHWTLAGLATLLILSAAAAVRSGRWVLKLHAATVALLLVGLAALPVWEAVEPREYTTGWSRLADEVRHEPFDFVVSPDYRVASELGYCLRPAPACDFTAVGHPESAFQDWWKAAELAGKNAVLVFHPEHFAEDLELARRSFRHLDDPGRISITRWGSRRVTFYLVRAQGYRPG